ncbi:MAG: phage integrase N-terminal SAM-like domain-containing protein [Mariprofundus sp.]|nr:phage integrase N-terminal SAM-like domain-containing protein [Mariprofundus sp.]
MELFSTQKNQRLVNFTEEKLRYHEIRNLSEQQLADYFIDRLGTHLWSAVKLDLYGLKFFYRYVLKQPWQHVDLIKPPRVKRLPDIVTVE